MAKNKRDLVARVRYSGKHDSFFIEILDEDGSWMLCASHMCRKAEGGSKESDHVHVSIVNQILQMVEMGYHIYKSDSKD